MSLLSRSQSLGTGISFPNLYNSPKLFLGHCLGIIPAPGNIKASGSPSPVKKSSETKPKISRVPREKSPLATASSVTTIPNETKGVRMSLYLYRTRKNHKELH
jgi:hypothetical protein